MYRYRDTNGSTFRSLASLEKHRHKIGDLVSIRGYVYFGKYNVNHSAILIKGTLGTMRLNGFSWGYNGEGPRGLKQALYSLSVPESEISRVLALPWDGWDKAGTVWTISMSGIAVAA